MRHFIGPDAGNLPKPINEILITLTEAELIEVELLELAIRSNPNSLDIDLSSRWGTTLFAPILQRPQASCISVRYPPTKAFPR